MMGAYDETSAVEQEPSATQSEEGLGIAQNIAWNSVGNIAYLIVQWVLSFLVVRVLGYGPAGIFSLAMSVGNTVCALAAYSMRNYQASDVEGAYSDRQYVISRIVTSVVSIAATCVFVFAQGYDTQTAICVILYACFRISEAVSDVYQAIQQKHLRMDYVGKAYMLKSVAQLVAFTATLFLTRDLILAVVSLIPASFLVIMCYERPVALRLSGDDYNRRGERYRDASDHTVLQLLWICAPMAIYGVVFNTLIQIPRYQLEAMCGHEILGIYASVAMPVTLVQVAANYLFTPLTTPMALMLKEGRARQFLMTFLKVVGGIAVVSVFAFLAAALLGEPVYVLLYGESIREHVYLMYPLIVCSVLTALAMFFANTLIILRKLNVLLVGSLAALAVAVASSGMFIERFGMNGASFACIVSQLVLVGIAGCALVAARAKAIASNGEDGDGDNESE